MYHTSSPLSRSSPHLTRAVFPLPLARPTLLPYLYVSPSSLPLPPFPFPSLLSPPRAVMVCIECIVVPVVVLILSFASQLFTHLWRLIFPATTPTPPPFNPASINLAAHGLAPPPGRTAEAASADVDLAQPSKEVEDADLPQDESKEGPVVRKQRVKA